jgi:outer membrane receptor for ferrienterochelin and colicins
VKNRFTYFLLLCLGCAQAFGQNASIQGYVLAEGEPIPSASVVLKNAKNGTATDAQGYFELKDLKGGELFLEVSFIGYETLTQAVTLKAGERKTLYLELQPHSSSLDEVVVSGTLKEVSRSESPVPVEVFKPAFFRKNPTPSIFDALQNVNGVRPQLNCNVCNTGDIHINGLEGPYTMVLIDGMPIVSGLSTVYGLSGIPNALVERIEIVKGPASSLYGSEAVGGLINIITKNPGNAPLFTADVFTTSWQEHNADIGLKNRVGDKATVLTGINYFNYNNPIDNNEDGFTDVTLQNRISVFQKWNFSRDQNRLFSLAGRYYYEDRWGGEMDWTADDRGGDEVYGESIYTRRWELIGNYQLPVSERIFLGFSYNDHSQNSVYGDLPYLADQRIAFSQLTWDKTLGRHDLLVGSAMRYTFYDDNTPATSNGDSLNLENQPDETWLPGIFVQDNISLNDKHKLLLGARYDYNSRHGNIFTPRIAYKWTINRKNILRLNLGQGFRVVNLFTEEHAALTGARTVEITEELRPETSYNANLNYVRKIYLKNGAFIGLDASAWYTWFDNQILPDYDTDPNKIIYDNLDGYAVTQGATLNADITFPSSLKIRGGITYMDVFTAEPNASGQEVKTQPILTENWAGTFAVSYTLKRLNLSIDYTGNVYGPMRLPTLGSLDPRDEYSPWWSIQNIQVSWKKPQSAWEVYGGIKNLLNFTPPANSIARANDPFDRNVEFDPSGNVLPTASNPNALSFDPTYVFAPNQGIRFFAGLRYSLP